MHRRKKISIILLIAMVFISSFWQMITPVAATDPNYLPWEGWAHSGPTYNINVDTKGRNDVAELQIPASCTDYNFIEYELPTTQSRTVVEGDIALGSTTGLIAFATKNAAGQALQVVVLYSNKLKRYAGNTISERSYSFGINWVKIRFETIGLTDYKVYVNNVYEYGGKNYQYNTGKVARIAVYTGLNTPTAFSVYADDIYYYQSPFESTSLSTGGDILVEEWNGRENVIELDVKEQNKLESATYTLETPVFIGSYRMGLALENSMGPVSICAKNAAGKILSVILLQPIDATTLCIRYYDGQSKVNTPFVFGYQEWVDLEIQFNGKTKRYTSYCNGEVVHANSLYYLPYESDLCVKNFQVYMSSSIPINYHGWFDWQGYTMDSPAPLGALGWEYDDTCEYVSFDDGFSDWANIGGTSILDGIVGTSLQFDSTTDMLYKDDVPAFRSGTFECYFQPTDLTDFRVILNVAAMDDSATLLLRIDIVEEGHLRAISRASTTWGAVLWGTLPLQIGKPYHIAYTFGELGEFLYVNGELEDCDVTDTDGISNSDHLSISLGDQYSPQKSALGYYDEFRVSKKQHHAPYLTRVKDSTMKILAHLNGNSIDYASGYPSSGVADVVPSPFVGQNAKSITSTTNRIHWTHNTYFSSGTFECYFCPLALTEWAQIMGATDGYSTYAVLRIVNGKLNGRIKGAGHDWSDNIYGVTPLELYKTYHVAMTFGTWGFRIYLNGVLEAMQSSYTYGLDSAATRMGIGRMGTSSSYEAAVGYYNEFCFSSAQKSVFPEAYPLLLEGDNDGDNVYNWREFLKFSDPLDTDSDNDLLDDYEEFYPGLDGYITSPIDMTTDDDVDNDYAEFIFHTNPTLVEVWNGGYIDCKLTFRGPRAVPGGYGVTPENCVSIPRRLYWHIVTQINAYPSTFYIEDLERYTQFKCGIVDNKIGHGDMVEAIIEDEIAQIEGDYAIDLLYQFFDKDDFPPESTTLFNAIINANIDGLSLSYPPLTPVQAHDLIEYYGIFIASGTGNENTKDQFQQDTINLDAEHPGVYAVGLCNYPGNEIRRWKTSNTYGSNYGKVPATGVFRNALLVNVFDRSRYFLTPGTSWAAPQMIPWVVTALSYNPLLDSSIMKSLIIISADLYIHREKIGNNYYDYYIDDAYLFNEDPDGSGYWIDNWDSEMGYGVFDGPGLIDAAIWSA